MNPRTAPNSPREAGPGLLGQRGRHAHPPWCAANHSCSAHTITDGTHRSHPLVWDTRAGRFIATRVQNTHGGGLLELRIVAELHPDEHIAHQQAARLAHLIDQAVTAVHAHTRRHAA